MATIKPKPEPSAKTTEPEHKENRYVRAFNVLAADNTLPLDQIAKKADLKGERAARGMVDAWNAAVHALDARAALAVDSASLIHDAPADAQNGFSRVVRILATEGDLDVAELIKRANVSEATARRAAEAYRTVLAAQAGTRNGKKAA